MKEYFGFINLKNESSLEKKLVEMSPREFIQKIMLGAKFHKIETYIDKNKAIKYSEIMKQGEKFSLPYLINYANYTIHEGRYRAYAAIVLGLKIIPVHIIDKLDKSYYL